MLNNQISQILLTVSQIMLCIIMCLLNDDNQRGWQKIRLPLPSTDDRGNNTEYKIVIILSHN